MYDNVKKTNEPSPCLRISLIFIIVVMNAVAVIKFVVFMEIPWKRSKWIFVVTNISLLVFGILWIIGVV